MGLFWDYFKNTIRFPLILKAGPFAQLAKGGAEVLDGVRDGVLWLRDQFTSELCKDDYLDSHGESRRMPRLWDEENDDYRTRINDPWEWHYWCGRDKGIKAALELVIDKTFEVIWYPNDHWRVGRSNVGEDTRVFSSSMYARFKVAFDEILTDDEYQRVDETLRAVKAARDIFTITQHHEPWHVGISQVGSNTYMG